MAYAMGPREDKALFDAARSGDADGVARAIAARANLDSTYDVSVITEEERRPPHRLCGRVPRVGRSVVGRASSSVRPHAS